MLHPQPYDVIAVELSSFQLHWSRSLAPPGVCVPQRRPDHVDWHGSLDDYTGAKGRVYQNTQIACIYNVQDPVTEQLVMDADVAEGCRAIGFTLGTPGLSMIGVVDDVIADRAFVERRETSAAELATLADVQGDAPSLAPHYLANALAAAALARAYGVPAVAVRDGLRAFTPDPHRIADAGTVEGRRFIDDSKATNPTRRRPRCALRARRLGGRWSAQGRRRRPPRRGRRVAAARVVSSGPTGPRSRGPGPTRPRCAGRRPRQHGH